MNIAFRVYLRNFSRCSQAVLWTMTKFNAADEGAVATERLPTETMTCDNFTEKQTANEVSKRISSHHDLRLDDGFNVSFAGCGFLAIYHVGVAKELLHSGPHVVSKVNRWGGASAGAVAAAAIVCLGSKLEDAVELLKDLVDIVQKQPLGMLTPGFDMLGHLRAQMERHLPSGSYKLANKKLFISVTRVSDGKNVLLTEFDSDQELIEALLCSCYIPIYCGFRIPTFRGQRYVDGGITGNLPIFPVGKTLCVSPFSGPLQDICPADESWLSLSYVVAGHSFLVCSQNVWRAVQALLTPNKETVKEYLERGAKDAATFLEEKGLLEECVDER